MAFFSLVVLACAHNPGPAAVFSERWHQDARVAIKEEARREPEGEIVLSERNGQSRVAVRLDEEGKPRLQFGKRDARVRVDLRMKKGAPDVRFGYRLKWGRGHGKWPVPEAPRGRGQSTVAGDP